LVSVLLAFLLATTLFFAYLNGLSDSANIVATVISTHALSMRRAMLMTALAVLIAPFIFGLAVAHTFGATLIHPGQVTARIVLAATWSAILWRLLTWRFGWPASSSHALVGGLVGAALAGAGGAAVQWVGLFKVGLSLIVSPVLGLLTGYALTRLLYYLAQWVTPRINAAFRLGQVMTALTLALSWGANDAQKAIGLLALGMAVANGRAFVIEPWMVLAAMSVVALGAIGGGGRLMRTLGGRFYKIRPIHGLSAQAAAAGVILGAAFAGAPVSTTQVVSTSILGAGAAERLNQVRWGLAEDILWAWVFTLPATGLGGAGLFLALHAWA
jgi:PiT family inorganic phosphate transporter